MKPPDPNYTIRTQSKIASIAFFGGKPIDLPKRVVPTLYCGTEEGTILLYDRDTRRIKGKWEQHSSTQNRLSSIFHLEISSDKLFSQGRHGVVSIWDTDVGKPVSEIATVPHSFCVSSALEVDGNVLLAAPYQNTSQFGIWDTRDPAKPIRNIDPSKENNKLGMCMHLKLMKFGTKCAVVSSYEDGGIYFWDILTTKLLMSNKLHTQPALCLSVNKESNRGLSGSADNNIVAFSFNYDTLSLKIDAKLPLQKPGIAAIKFRDDEKIFASAGWDHRIRIFDAKKLKPLAILKYHTAAVNDIAFSNVDNLLVSVSSDQKIALWNIY